MLLSHYLDISRHATLQSYIYIYIFLNTSEYHVINTMVHKHGNQWSGTI